MTAPVSRSTACSGLEAKRVRPSFRRVILASGSLGLAHSAFEVRLPLRRRSSRLSSAAVGVAIPLSLASRASIAR